MLTSSIPLFRKAYSILLGLFWTVPLLAGAAVIDQVSFIFPENDKISETYLQAQIESGPGLEFSPDRLSSDIRRLYETGIVSDVEARAVEAEAAGKVELRFHITPAPEIKEVIFVGNESISDSRLRDMIPLAPGERVNTRRLTEGRREIREFYRERGFHNATVEIEEKETKAGLVLLRININEDARHKIRSVNFVGNQVYSDRQLRRNLQTRRSLWAYIFNTGFLDPDKLEADREILRELYEDKGHLDFEIEEIERGYSRNDKWISITFHLNEGETYNVKSIGFSGNREFDDQELRELLSLQENMTYSRGKQNQDVQRIRNQYSRLGYIDLICRPRLRPDSENMTVDLTYHIQEGQPARIREILIVGNQVTQDHVLRREVALEPGELADSRKIERTESRLRNLQYFEEVQINPLPTEKEDEKDLEIAVKETMTGRWGIGGGISSDTGFFGFLEVQETNFDIGSLFHLSEWPPKGAGQRASFRTTMGTEVMEFNLSFVEPWLLGHRLRLQTDLYHRTYDQYEYDERRTGVAVSLGRQVALGPDREGRLPWWRGNWRQSIGYRLDQVKLTGFSTDASDELLAEEGDYIASALTLGMSRDTRDSFRLPTRGGLFEANLELQSEAIGAYSNIYKLELEGSRYLSLGRYRIIDNLPIIGDSVLKLSGGMATVDQISGDGPAIFDRYFAGGQYTLRGFERREVSPTDINDAPLGGGSRLLATTELMYPVHDSVWLSIFCDLGNVWRKSWDWNPGDMNSSVGVGLQLDLRMIPLRLDYGLPVTTQQDHLDTGGRIHFSLGRSF